MGTVDLENAAELALTAFCWWRSDLPQDVCEAYWRDVHGIMFARSGPVAGPTAAPCTNRPDLWPAVHGLSFDAPGMAQPQGMPHGLFLSEADLAAFGRHWTVGYRPMPFDNVTNTETSDSKPEDEPDGVADTEREESSSDNTVETGEDQAAQTAVSGATGHDSDLGADDEVDEPVAKAPVAASSGGFVAGTVAVVSAGLGVVSLTGTGLGDMLRNRQEIIGQIELGAGGRGADQVEALYGAPWHMAALIQGTVALVAILLGVGLLAAYAGRSEARGWVKSVALGGAVLGAFGLLVAMGMYFDLFAAQPEVSAVPLPSPGS